MKYFASHGQRLTRHGEKGIVFGVIGGRVDHMPNAKWLYSLRILFLIWKFEILWTTGEVNDSRVAKKVVRS